MLPLGKNWVSLGHLQPPWGLLELPWEHSIALQFNFKLIIRFYSFLANYPQIHNISNPQPVSSAAGVFYL